MGLLDSFAFSPQTYGGQNGGLLDLLKSISAGYQASPPQSENMDASPIAIGSYMMPRHGPQSLYEPQQSQLPVNAQPTQGQIPPQQAPASGLPQQQTLPAFLGGGQENPLMTGLHGFIGNLHNGPLGALAGGLGAAVTGKRTDDAGIAQQNLRAQYEALVPTLGPQKAMLAIMNPEAGKVLLQEALTNKAEWGIVKDDPITGKQYGWIDKNRQTVNGQPMGAGNTAQSPSSLESLQNAQNAGVKGEALYSHLPATIAPTVKAMIEGRQPLPSTTAMRSPATLALIDAAHAIDPTFDATVWKSRNEAGADWSKGKSAEMVRSANQTLAHVGSLMDAMDNLKNRSIPAWNAVANTVSENLGTGEQGAFRTNAHAVAEEMSKVFKGANLSDSEIRHWEQNLSENMSPAQQKAQVAKLSELLHGSLQALEEKRVSAMGPAAAAKAGPLIKAEGQAVLERIDKWLKGQGGSAPAARSGGLPSGWSVQVR